ncbi:MAG: cation:proton antiporter [Dehalococcoidia bacterium]|nr:cation:proton antiporter [Dehalococcoidia bacterium]
MPQKSRLPNGGLRLHRRRAPLVEWRFRGTAHSDSRQRRLEQAPADSRRHQETVIDDTNLLVTLVTALGAAGVGALVAASLRQSVVVGYILAGLLIGPHTPGVEASTPAVEELADIGVILLLFAIGAQLSFAEMVRVGPAALLGGSAQVTLMIAVGWGAGVALGWGHVESLFFGAVLSNSSSTVLVKVLGELGEEDSLHGRLALAWSTVQDFSTIILVVVLTTLAEGSGDRLPLDVLEAIGLAALYLAIVIPPGLVLLPRFFDRVAALGSSEVLMLAAASVALGIAYLASLFGISVALGAFVGGMLVARSEVAHEVLGQIIPLRNLFAGLFFVSVGMLIDPGLVIDNVHLVAVGVVLIVVVKGAMVSLLGSLFRYRASTALLTGVVLGQSAEFSFLLARVGTQVDAVSTNVFGVMLTSAAASIILAPLLLRAAHPVAASLDRRMSASRPEGNEQPAGPGVRDHTVICGYGRVGRVVHRTLALGGVDCVVIDQDRAAVEELRRNGAAALRGDAANALLLERAGAGRARALVVALPDPLACRQVVSFARRLNPGIDIVVRTHSVAEQRFLERAGANHAVVGELELGFEMSRHTLHLFGVATDVAEELLEQGRAFENARPPGLP